MTEYALKTDNLTKIYKNNKAVNEVSMHIRRGDIYGLIGKNGAGKTTIMRMIAGLAIPNKGSMQLFESSDLNFQRQRLGCSIENPAIYPNMTAQQNLEVYRRLLGIPEAKIISDIIETIGLRDVEKKKAKNFSLGMKQRLELGITLLGNPDFLILDEPINGLDPEGIMEFRDLLLKLNKEKQITILISSHILGELSKMATCYGIINQGVLVEEFSKEELSIKCKRCLKIKVDNVQKASSILETICGTTDYDILPENTIRLFDYLEKPGYVNTELSKNDVVVDSITLIGQDLENYFMELMGGKKHD